MGRPRGESAARATTDSPLKLKVFEVEYYGGNFKARKNISIAPCIDFDLGDEPGYGSPDSSAGVGVNEFSIRWTGKLVAPAAGAYTFAADSDGLVRLWIGETQVIDKAEHKRHEVAGTIELTKGKEYPAKVEYVHRDGNASAHVYWRGPG